LHITQSEVAMGDNDWTITVEDSADDSTFATIGTFTADGSAATAETLSIAGTIRRYVRAVLTQGDEDDLICWINFIRL
jgi:hypothetical protein